MSQDEERRKIIELVVALGLGAALACAAPEAAEKDLSSLRTRAALDFKCPEERIVIEQVDEATRAASGCGKRATYLNRARPCEAGEHPDSDGRCDAWLQNSIEDKAGGEAPAP